MNLHWVTTWWVVIYALSAHRLTRLITRDSLPPVARLRDYVLNRWGDSDWSELVVCPWCMGFWIAAGTTALVSTPVAVAYQWIAVPLAMSTVIGMIAGRE